MKHKFLSSRFFYFTLLSFFTFSKIAAQYTGIGTTTPGQVLDVYGKLKVGNDNTPPTSGTIRFNQATKDFEGFNGTEWKSLTASNTSGPNIFTATVRERKGDAISIYGDFAAVGAPWNGSGVVYIMQRINNSWVLTQTLSQPQGSFGNAVAMYGDYLVVGSPFYSNPFGRGRISLYKKVNSVFTFLTHYHPSVYPDTEYFGGSVSLYGGLIVVGCITNLRGYSSATNRVHVLSILNDGLQPEQVVFNPNTPAQEDFGITVAIDSTKLIIGAPKADNFGNVDRGKVYVYAYAGANTYSYTNTVEYAAYGGDNDYFGEDVSLSGDKLVIGCPGLDINPLFNIGAFFICTKDGAGNFESASLSIITHPFDTPDSYFGKSVAVSNDVILVGSNKAVYQYININGAWQLHKTLSNSLPGIAQIDASVVALHGQNYGIGNPLFNSDDGRAILGDCRY